MEYARRVDYNVCIADGLPSFVVSRAAPMATAEDTGDKKVASEAKEAITDMMAEGVHEVSKHKPRARKPRIGNMAVRQTWDECVGENHARVLSLASNGKSRASHTFTHDTGSYDTEWLLVWTCFKGVRTLPETAVFGIVIGEW